MFLVDVNFLFMVEESSLVLLSAVCILRPRIDMEIHELWVKDL